MWNLMGHFWDQKTLLTKLKMRGHFFVTRVERVMDWGEYNPLNFRDHKRLEQIGSFDKTPGGLRTRHLMGLLDFIERVEKNQSQAVFLFANDLKNNVPNGPFPVTSEEAQKASQLKAECLHGGYFRRPFAYDRKIKRFLKHHMQYCTQDYANALRLISWLGYPIHVAPLVQGHRASVQLTDKHENASIFTNDYSVFGYAPAMVTWFEDEMDKQIRINDLARSLEKTGLTKQQFTDLHILAASEEVLGLPDLRYDEIMALIDFKLRRDIDFFKVFQQNFPGLDWKALNAKRESFRDTSPLQIETFEPEPILRPERLWEELAAVLPGIDQVPETRDLLRQTLKKVHKLRQSNPKIDSLLISR